MINDMDRSPVVFLLDNIKEVLNITTGKLSNERQNAIKNLRINIKLDSSRKFYTPQADLESHIITISESYLSYLWCCCYAIVGLSDIMYKKAYLNKSVVTFNDDPEYPKINCTLGWGRSLKDSYSTWPINAANPTQDLLNVSNANNLLTFTIVYQLFHEIGHLVLHSNMSPLMKAIKGVLYKPTDDEKKRVRNAEGQADDYAFDCLKTSSSSEEVKFIKYLGAVVAHLSGFYQLDVPDTRGFTHPDLDDRLIAVIKKIDLREEYYQIHMKASCSIGLQLFMSLTATSFIPDNLDDADFKDFEDLHSYLFALIARIKHEGSTYHSRN